MESARLVADPGRLARSVLLAVVGTAAALFAVFILVWRLDWIGFTWDEYIDYQIATSLVGDFGNVFKNDLDPSQGRLNHMIAYPALKLMGESLFSFKVTYVVVGLSSIFAMYRVLQSAVSRTTAALFALLFATMPYFLSGARTGGTAGDSLTLLTTILVVWALGHWTTRASAGSGDRWAPVWTGIACGLATGAKLTNGLLVPLTIVWIGDVCGWRKSARGLLKFVATATLIALLAHPLFFRGPLHLYDALRHSHGFDNAVNYLYLGEWVKRTPWYFPAAILMAKTSLPFFAFFAVALADNIWRTVRKRESDTWIGISFLVLTLAYLFVFKRFQNVHYYLPALVPMIIISAKTAERLLESPVVWVRALTFSGFGLLVVFQSWTNWQLSPDFLQAGRQYGPRFQGQMAGPAVNHCQGGPVAIAEFNDLQRKRPYPRAYVLLHCGPILHQDEVSGPVKPDIPIAEFDLGKHPDRPYRLLVHRVYDYSEGTPAELAHRQAERDQILRGCRLESKDPRGAYRIFACDE